MSLGVVRVRGSVNVPRDIQETLEFLRLHRVNHCVLVPANDAVRGMLQKAKDYVTWGEVTPEVVARLLAERGRLRGDKPLTAAYVKEALGFPSLDALAKEVAKGDAAPGDWEDVKPVFRLHPPRKGYEGIKRPFADGGALGDRGEAINDLLLRMLG